MLEPTLGHRRTLLSSLLIAALSIGCSDSDDTSSGTQGGGEIGFNDAAIADLRARGVNKYLGKATLAGDPVVVGDETTYEFDTENGSGPICLWGSPYRASIRDKGSDDLLIYLQGGGACRASLCAASTDAVGSIPATGILNDDASDNVVASWNVLYAPYCDGSTFSGDNEIDNGAVIGPNGETTRYHRGVRNLSAALDQAQMHFPTPKRILLAGSSAGGYGTILGTALARFVYPNTPLIVFADSGAVLASDNPAVIPEMVDDWKMDQFFPSSCTGCGPTHVAGVVAWGLRNDPSLRVAAFSSYQDSTLSYFLELTPDSYRSVLLDQTGKVHDEFPDRFRRFFVNGQAHTSLILEVGNESLAGYSDEFDGLSVSDWTRAFVDDTSDWVDFLQN